ncbi:MAG: hypothetical protein IT175_01075 [Acidobacteria bacterium]|nr:hypothetical protein [Acidobacteriota bacterium]
MAGIPKLLNISGKQFSKKLIRRAQEMGLDPSNEIDRLRFLDRIQQVFDKAEEVRRGSFRGQGADGAEGEVLFFRHGQDVLVTSPNGDFVTFLSGGAANQRFLNGRVIP